MKPLGHDLIVYRGAGGLPEEFTTVGNEFVERGFCSTSFDRSVAEGFTYGYDTQNLFRLKIPSNVKGIFMGDSIDSLGASEVEVLLERGLKFKVTGSSEIYDRVTKMNINMLDLEVIGHD